ncbi:MAG: BMC domain-containing protein [Armatimonadetes bacterium]|nr:BMC domain-containing protein [Armatimonadota bacterium]
MSYHAIGLLELNSIAKGIETADAMIKTAKIELIEAHPVCSGKYLILIAGSVDAVKASIEKGKEVSSYYLVDFFLISNIHSQVFPALSAATQINELKALGIIETFSAASAILAADYAVKSAQVDLIEIRLCSGLGGKSFITLTGEVAAVEAAIKAGEEIIKEEGSILSSVVIPSPHEDLNKAVF